MNLKPLLDLIAKGESGAAGYDAMYFPAERALGKHKLSTMSLNDIRALQERMKKYGSSACGRYQFLQKTLDATRKTMSLTGIETWTPQLQDTMAITLLNNRGLGSFMLGTMSREAFANNLAKEWASLPVVTAIKGAKRQLTPGYSYYDGDGLNKALHTPGAVLEALDALKASALPSPIPDVEPPPAPIPAPPKEGFQKPSLQQTMIFIMAAVVAGVVALLSKCSG